MTVVHVLDHSLPMLSGYSTRSRNIVSFQRELGLRPVVVTSPKHTHPGSPMETLEGIRHYRTPADGSLSRLPYVGELGLMGRLARRLREVARLENARVIHAHSSVLNGLPALRVARRLGVPLVYESRAFWEDAAVDHGTTREASVRYRITRALETFLFKRADRVVVIAHAMRAEVVRRGVDANRIAVVGNGVDTDRFRPVPRHRGLVDRLGLDGGFVLGFIGSFYHYEGLRFLMEAFPALKRRLPEARLLLVGGGAEEARLRSMAETAGDGVIFAGQVPYDQIHDYYSVIDVFVCPRRRMRLTELVTPLKPLEAMAMGCPVLASDVGGLAELIQPDSTGILFPAESADALVEAATRLGRSPQMRERLGREARTRMVAERGWRHVVSGYLPVYGALSS